MRRIYLALISILYITGNTAAQDTAPLPLSLKDCMDYAAKHNYTLKNAQLDVMIQKAQVAETLAAAYPHINGKAELDDYIVPMQTYFPTGTFGEFLEPVLQPIYNKTNTPYPEQSGPAYSAIPIYPKYNGTAAISGSQTIFDGSVLVALQARNTVMQLAQQARNVTAETIKYNILKSYNALVIAYRQYEITKNSLVYARSMEHDLEVTRQNGMAEKIDVERTTVQVNNLATDSISIGNMLEISEQALKYQIGMDISTPIILTDTNLETHKNNVLALLSEEKNYNRVPEYDLSLTQLELNNYNLKHYKLEAYPTLNLIGNAGYNYASQDFSDFFTGKNYLSSVMVGVQLNVPIFNGLLRVNQVREAKLNVEKSQNNIEYVKQTIDFQAAQSRTTLRNTVLEVQSQRRNLDLANDVLDLAQRKYKAGVGSNLEVTQAQTDQLRAQTNYFNAELDLINAEADLRKALGLL